MASLFKEVESGTKKPKTQDLGPQGPMMVSDSSHISSLIEEVLREQQATPEELTQWAGNRTKLNEEVPWIVEQVVGAKLTERRFKAMVEGVINPKQLGSFINGLTDRHSRLPPVQPSGWMGSVGRAMAESGQRMTTSALSAPTSTPTPHPRRRRRSGGW